MLSISGSSLRTVLKGEDKGCKHTVGAAAAAIAQHHEGGLSSILLAQEKTKIQGTVPTECVLLWHHHKVKNCKSSHKSGIICVHCGHVC